MKISKKNIVLFGSLIILLAISYVFSFSKTIEAKIRYSNLVKESREITDLPSKLNYLKQQESYFDSILGSNRINSESSFQNNLLRKINENIHNKNIEIVSFQQPHSFLKEESKINTYIFKLKGSFNDILTLINNLENDGNYGKVLSLNFEKSFNYKTKQPFLECLVLLQQQENME
jgi:hypothetical protein